MTSHMHNVAYVDGHMVGTLHDEQQSHTACGTTHRHHIMHVRYMHVDSPLDCFWNVLFSISVYCFWNVLFSISVYCFGNVLLSISVYCFGNVLFSISVYWFGNVLFSISVYSFGNVLFSTSVYCFGNVKKIMIRQRNKGPASQNCVLVPFQVSNYKDRSKHFWVRDRKKIFTKKLADKQIDESAKISKPAFLRWCSASKSSLRWLDLQKGFWAGEPHKDTQMPDTLIS